MKPINLPQSALVRLLALQDVCETAERDARMAEAAVAKLRRILSSGTSDVTPDVFAEARAGFEAVHTGMQRARIRANAQAKLLASVKAWVESLPASARLVLVPAPDEGANLASVRNELKEARAELRRLENFPPASADIGARVHDYVTGLARAALPLVRGYAQGQRLDVRWAADLLAERRNGSGFNTDDGSGLLIAAALFPDRMAGLILEAVKCEQPLSAAEHAERVNQLNERITALSYAACEQVARTGGEHDPEASPACLLGVRVESSQEAAA